MTQPGNANGGGGRVRHLNYTVGHLERVELIALEMFDNLPGDIKDSLVDPADYRAKVGLAAMRHDLAKCEWAETEKGRVLLCGAGSPSNEEWLKSIYPHSEHSAAIVLKNHQEALKRGRAVRKLSIEELEFLICHHLRYDGKNMGHVQGRFFYGRKKIVICSSEEAFNTMESENPIWFMNKVKHNGEIIKHPGYGPRHVYLCRGVEIPLGGRILKIADAYDAMTTNRTYESNKTSEEAIGQIEGRSGSEYCPVGVDAIKAVNKKRLEEITRMAA